MRTACIAPGKFAEALQFATVGIFLDGFGEVGTIRWFVDYENLASLEKIMDQIYADPDWFKKVSEAKDLFIEGKTHDLVMRSL
jgi:hypothetical protein